MSNTFSSAQLRHAGFATHAVQYDAYFLLRTGLLARVALDFIIGYRLPVTLEAEQEWVRRARRPESDNRLVYGIELRSNGELIGYTNLNDIDWFSDTAEFGIMLGPSEYRGRGIGREVLSAMIEIAFESLRLYKLYVRVAAFNAAAQKIFADAGFVVEGVLKEHFALNDARHDVVMMRLLRPEPGDDG